MKAKRLAELLLGASLLVGASGCPCPDGHVEDEAHVTRAMFEAQINTCLASDDACNQLCRAVFELQPEAAIEACVITGLDAKSAVVAVKYYEPVECIGGRRPGGFVEPGCRSRAAGEWLARIATVEAASITAFARLVRALERFGAPARPIAAARDAILDEIVHARLTARLARRLGATIEVPVIARTDEPTLEQLALENAVEGQVAETFGALLATCQGQLATDPAVRAVFTQIAIDETRHAALAHELARWFDTAVDGETRLAIAKARREAAATIVDQFDVHLSATDRALLGIPDVDLLRIAAARTFVALTT
jgi:hypothetical protein